MNNGFTPSVDVKEQIKNLSAVLSDDALLGALCWALNQTDGNAYDFVRFLCVPAATPECRADIEWLEGLEGCGNDSDLYEFATGR